MAVLILCPYWLWNSWVVGQWLVTESPPPTHQLLPPHPLPSHLGQVVQEGVGRLLAELLLGEGEEAGLLLDDIAGDQGVTEPPQLDSLEDVLAAARLDAAPPRALVRQGLEEALRLVLVLEDAPG